MPQSVGNFQHVIDSPVGRLTIGAVDDAVTHVLFGEHRLRGAINRSTPAIERTVHQLHEYFEGSRRHFELTLAPAVTAFQARVLEALRQVQCGTTVTYGRIAHAIDSPRASQAVGQAVGANPIGIIIPCHRVIPATGALGGFAGGAETKKALLALEGFMVDSSGRVVRA